MILVISEKPSVAQQIAKVIGADQRKDGYMEGNGYIVSWCLGHLAEYVPPESYDSRYKEWHFEDLPIIPVEWKLSIASDKKSQFEVVKSLLNCSDIEYVINACDAGREGELIFARVYELSGAKAPIKRLWISSLEDKSIRKGFEELKDARMYEGLKQAAICRAKADWIVGMNATRAYSSTYYTKLRVGRVQTPTLAMLVEREGEIKAFAKEKYYNVKLDLGEFKVSSERIDDSGKATVLAKESAGKVALVIDVDVSQKKQNAPKLFDLTTLQRECNRYFGYTAKQTLDVAQSLYEKKLITYPRTDSQYITKDMTSNFAGVLTKVWHKYEELSPKGSMTYIDNFNCIVNDAKVTDHHAIIVTNEIDRMSNVELDEREEEILRLIAAKMVMAISNPYVYEQVKIFVDCVGTSFTTSGVNVRNLGWRAVLDSYQSASGIKQEDSGESQLSYCEIRPGMEFDVLGTSVDKLYTKPPKEYTEDSLLGAMERAGNKVFDSNTEKKGLGTPATRASIIEKLVRSGYVKRKKNKLTPTDEGVQMIEVVSNNLKSPMLTADWENQLLAIERSEIDASSFMNGIKELVDTVLHDCKGVDDDSRQMFRLTESIGVCPKCGGLVFEKRKNFKCSNSECDFTLWKDNFFLTKMGVLIDANMATELLKTGRTHSKNLISPNTGNTFAADIVMDTSGERIRFDLEFPTSRNKR